MTKKFRALFYHLLHITCSSSSYLLPVTCYLLLVPVLAFAQNALKLQNPIKYGTIDDFLLAIVAVAVQYGAIIVVLFLVLAGFKFVAAQGNPEKITEAKKMLAWVVVGAFVLLGVFVIREAICGTVNKLREGTDLPEVCVRDASQAPGVGGYNFAPGN